MTCHSRETWLAFSARNPKRPAHLQEKGLRETQHPVSLTMSQQVIQNGKQASDTGRSGCLGMYKKRRFVTRDLIAEAGLFSAAQVLATYNSQIHHRQLPWLSDKSP